LAFGDNTTMGTGDGDILISLKPDDHGPTAEYTVKLRKRLHQKFPDVGFFFEAANITNQILNFGLPAPIDLQVVGRDPRNYQIAEALAERISHIPGAADVHVHQIVDYPELRINVDRSKAGQLGLQQRDVSNSLLISLSSSGQVTPNEWLNWSNGVSYFMAVQTPQYRMDSLAALMRTPISAPIGASLAPRRVAGGHGRRLGFDGGVEPQPEFAGLRQSGRGGRRSAASLEPGQRGARRVARDYQPLQRAAGFRRLRQCGPAGPGQRRLGGGENHARSTRESFRAAPVSTCAARCAPWRLRSTGWAWA
jgi:hypothetical protein